MWMTICWFLSFRQEKERPRAASVVWFGVNEPSSLTGLVAQVTIRGHLGRPDGSTSRPMLHLLVYWDWILLLSGRPRTCLRLRHGKLSVPNRGSPVPAQGSELHLSR